VTEPIQSSGKLVSLYMEAITRRDTAVVDRFFHPDVEYIVNGTASRDTAAQLPSISEQCGTALPWAGA
jgi:hypothetical protein